MKQVIQITIYKYRIRNSKIIKTFKKIIKEIINLKELIYFKI
jgi:hypothetical protein